jgi:hypothetical protein
VHPWYDTEVQALRVALLTESTGAALQIIEAENWIDARDVVDTRQFRHVPGFGWFLKS